MIWKGYLLSLKSNSGNSLTLLQFKSKEELEVDILILLSINSSIFIIVLGSFLTIS